MVVGSRKNNLIQIMSLKNNSRSNKTCVPVCFRNLDHFLFQLGDAAPISGQILQVTQLSERTFQWLFCDIYFL